MEGIQLAKKEAKRRKSEAVICDTSRFHFVHVAPSTQESIPSRVTIDALHSVMYTHKVWPIHSIERLLAYVFALFQALAIALLVGVAGSLQSATVTTAYGALVAAQALALPTWMDVVILRTSDPEPRAHTVVYTLLTVVNAALTITWVLMLVFDKTTKLFTTEPGTSLTILLCLVMMAGAPGAALANVIIYPLKRRAAWHMRIKSD